MKSCQIDVAEWNAGDEKRGVLYSSAMCVASSCDAGAGWGGGLWLCGWWFVSPSAAHRRQEQHFAQKDVFFLWSSSSSVWCRSPPPTDGRVGR